MPRSSLTKAWLEAALCRDPGSVQQHPPGLLWDPSRLDGEVTSQQLSEREPAAAPPSNRRVVSGNCHTGCRDGAEVETHRGRPQLGGAKNLFFFPRSSALPGNSQANEFATTRQRYFWSAFFPSQLHY